MVDNSLPVRILLVDDSPINLKLLGNLLRGMGELFVATNGEMALQVAHDKLPDLILLDVEMPGKNGYEVCHELKQDPLLCEAAVIFVTSHQSMEHEIRALEAGAVDFITKPLNPPVVRARVNTHLTLKQQSDKLRQMANIDGMTGVFNRRAFDGMLTAEYRRHMRALSPLALVMMDVDHFKRFNDCYGHLAGDDCLRTIAHTAVTATRRPAETVCRYGGEEFAIILPNTTQEQAMNYGQWLLGKIRELALPHQGQPETGIVTVSLGVSSRIPDNQGNPTELIQQADKALYRAKQDGRNRVVAYEPDLG